MLQIIKILIPVIIAAITSAANNSDSLSAEWMFENSFEKEYIHINEAVTVVPEELKGAIEFYEQGSYRRAADVLFQVRKLNLPDNNLDFIAFMLAECYRKLNLMSKAVEEYRFVATKFPLTDKRAPALYRLLENMAHEGNIESADSIRELFVSSMKNHPLYNSVIYTCGKLYFDQEMFEEAAEVLKTVEPHSQRYFQASFLSALCQVQLEEWGKAITQLEYIVKHSRDLDVRTEALIVIGDIHYKNNRIEKAIEYYKKVNEKASRYEYASVKITRSLLDMGKFEKAAEVAQEFLDTRESSEYFFEMASILEQAYENMGMDAQAAEVGSRIHRQIVGARITFELFDEIDRLTDIIKQWQIREYNALALADSSAALKAVNGKKKGEKLRQKTRALLHQIDRTGLGEEKSDVPHLAERRYLALLKKTMQRMEDSITVLKRTFDKTNEILREHPADSTLIASVDMYKQILDKKETEYNVAAREHDLIITECLGGDAQEKRISEEMQVKFIDWEFIKYCEKKEKFVDFLKKAHDKRTSAMTKDAGNNSETSAAAGTEAATGMADTTSAVNLANLHKVLQIKKDSLSQAENNKLNIDSIRQFKNDSAHAAAVQFTVDSNRIEQSIVEERERLISHIETMLDIFPKSRYATATIFRLAELYYDRAGDMFRKKMAVYERKLKESNDSSELSFPEYDLNGALKCYERLYANFPNDRYADNAMYYASLALRKQGLEDSAQKMMISMIEKYPQSEYYVEANMNIGSYYFEHAKDFKNGYKLSEESFRKVLFYRNHPQFVQALYHLGWCYYMQDRYEEAISTFKYMIEEVDLEFDPFAKEEKDIANPLLRTEAIDYLAISLDQDKKIDDAIEFFDLVGNPDYAALVMSRMGELREEDLDFSGAVSTYNLLLQKYPLSLSAPEATARLIKLYRNANDAAAADSECNNFIRKYGAGAKWQERVAARDPSLIFKIDSMVIAIGLSVADDAYRNAEQKGSYDLYALAAEHYKRIVEKYPLHPGAADAAWNLAALLDNKIGDKPGAFERFMSFSKLPGVDSTRRETAALNAIAIAQALMPADSMVQKGAVDFASAKMIEAVNNYSEQFAFGASASKVLFTMGGVYFNRNLYSEAAEIYKKILDKDITVDQRFEAMLLLGQCRFGEEKWAEAAQIFEKVWKGEVLESAKTKAYTLLLQSRFFAAKEDMQAGKFEEAAGAFMSIDEQFPGSEYGDVALFNAAESYEKLEQWVKATECYFALVKGYPISKLAPDALFNAAGNFEKSEKYSRAAETYETLIAQYPNSDKAKDGLFNLGFCYEKLGKLDEMTAANERYSLLYPEEKDVEALLLRSASYYVKTRMLDKAVSLYRNFIRRFPQSIKAVEAYYQIGKCQYDQGDNTNALLSFLQTEQHNLRIGSSGGTANNYYASEAALYHGIILQEQFSKIKLQQPETLLKQSMKEKSDLLAAAVKDYQRVMQYNSEKMFEAGFRIGEMYENMADALVNQERATGDPIKAAVNENEIMNVASQVLQNTFLPYKKVIELSKEADSLSASQKEWVERSRKNLGNNLILAGSYMYEGVGAMQKAPVPEEIRKQLLLSYQYQIKLLETLEPLKRKVLNYFVNVLDSLPNMHLDDSLTIQCEIHVARLNYLIGSAYDKLAIEILTATKDLPKDLADDQKEDLLFQLEDIVFELQDKAMLQLEDAQKELLRRKLENGDWYNKITASLARLNPDKYGKSFFTPVVYKTDAAWICRPDSALDWTTITPPNKGWIAAKIIRNTAAIKLKRPAGSEYVAGDSAWQTTYLWKNAFMKGKPVNAQIAVSVPGKYRLFINGVCTMSDTAGDTTAAIYDSLSNIGTLLKGGDNIISCELTAQNRSIPHGGALFAMSLNAMVDTSEHFISAVTIPAVIGMQTKTDAEGTLKTDTIVVQSSVDTSYKTPAKPAMSRKKLLEEIEAYRDRERKALAELRHERLEIQKLRIMKSYREQQATSPK